MSRDKFPGAMSHPNLRRSPGKGERGSHASLPHLLRFMAEGVVLTWREDPMAVLCGFVGAVTVPAFLFFFAGMTP